MRYVPLITSDEDCRAFGAIAGLQLAAYGADVDSSDANDTPDTGEESGPTNA